VITFEQKGDFRNSERFLKRMSKFDFVNVLRGAAQKGAQALAAATPVDSGLTANSWGYEVQRSRGSFSITWTNSHVEDGFPVAIGLQYGHGTGTGGYIRGRDYINPAMQPIFEQILNDVWTEVTTA
jgi:hypothetical protein